MKYEYTTVSVPCNLVCQHGLNLGETLAKYIENVINEMAQDGWEYYRTDSYSMIEAPSCLGALFGHKEKMGIYNVLVFRSELDKNVSGKE